MKKIDKYIEKKYKKYGIMTHAEGDLLLEHAYALKVIDECEKLNAIILGIDFWKRWKGDVMEFNSTAWDDINSGTNASKDTIKEARELLKDELPDNADYASFVLADK